MKKFFKKLFIFLIVIGVIGGAGYVLYTKTDIFSNTCTVTFDAQGGTVKEGSLDSLEIEKGSTIKLPTVEKEGYDFDGWYYGALKWDEKLMVSRNIELVAKWIPIKYKITFIVDGVSYDQMTDYDSMPVFAGSLEKAPTDTIVYTFAGWQPALVSVTGEATYTAKYTTSVRKYSVNVMSSIAGAGTLSGGGEFEYNESTTISVLPSSGYIFDGWYKNGTLYNSSTSFLLANINEDCTFVARWQGDEKTINFSVDGMTLSDETITTHFGTQISEPEIVTSKYGMSGYKIVGWFTDSACTNKYVFGDAPLNDIILYGKWEYILDQGFYPYLTKFQNASTSTRLQINSMDELVAWVEFVQFYNISTNYPLSLNFSYYDMAQTLSSAIDNSRYPSNAVMSYSQWGTPYVFVKSSYRASEYDLKTADPEKTSICTQQDYALSIGKQTARSETYDNFNINKISSTLQVETSNQLVYALEMGLRPVCKAGSPAEKMYNKAKQVLREICTDEMDDITKLRAIYEWLILNVAYDNAAAENANTITWQKYDAWYLEGIFNNGVAVCDAIAKAFTVLSQIENIAMIRVSGFSTSGTGHAWNKVYYDGAWFGMDATHGNILDSGLNIEVLSYSSFMFTDSFKLSEGYRQQKDGRDDIVANTVFNIYDTTTFNIGTSSEFDLIINSYEEYSKLTSYIKDYSLSADSTYFTIEVLIDDSLSLGIFNNYLYANGVYIRSYYNTITTIVGKTAYILLLQKN